MTTQDVTMRFAEMTAEQFQAHLDQRSVNAQRMVHAGVTASGRAEIEANMARAFEIFPDLHVQVRDLFTAGDRTCVQCTLSGTHKGEGLGFPATGRRVEYDACIVFRWSEDGLAEEEVIYADSATILTQLGLLPAP
jgi:steroid delta-isomerase-like uncharacterized protein